MVRPVASISRISLDVGDADDAFSAKRRPEQCGGSRHWEVCEGLAGRARQRIEGVEVALIVHDVVEERAECGTGQFRRDVGDHLHERREVELSRNRFADRVQRLERLGLRPALGEQAGALQRDDGLVRSRLEEKSFDVRRKIAAARSEDHHAISAAGAEVRARETKRAGARRVGHLGRRARGLVRRRRRIERFADLGGRRAASRPNIFDGREPRFVVRPEVREVDAEHAEDGVEDAGRDRGDVLALQHPGQR